MFMRSPPTLLSMVSFIMSSMVFVLLMAFSLTTHARIDVNVVSEEDSRPFIDVTKQAGAGVTHFPPIFDRQSMGHIMEMVSAGASGGAIGDYNKDGWLDVFVSNPRGGMSNTLLRNNGDMTFTNVIEQAGLKDINESDQVATMGIFFDYDGDTWQDLLVVRFGSTLLYRNNHDGTFSNVTKKAGFKEHLNALTAIAFDFDKDGDLDIYLGSYFRDLNMFKLNSEENNILHDSWEVSRNGGNNIFYVNNGDGTFTNKTEQLGLLDTGWTMALAHGDFDNDGWQDIYVANDYGTDILFRNTGKGSFENVTEHSLGFDTKKGMNAEVGDFDNDGDLDIFVTNVTEKFLYECNMLWQNNGDGQFVDVSQELGVCDTGWGWGGKFFDYNNDGWLDLYVANGFFTGDKKQDYLEILLPAIWESGEDPSNPKVWPPLDGMGLAASEANVLFTNRNGKYHREKNSGLELEKDSRAILIADFNNDGRVDIFVTNNNAKSSLFRNTVKGGHWLQIELLGKAPNTDAVGARIYAKAGKNTQMREVNIGNGFAGGSMTRQHFGFGPIDMVEELIVKWPDGSQQQYKNVKIDRIIRLSQSDYGIKTAWDIKK